MIEMQFWPNQGDRCFTWDCRACAMRGISVLPVEGLAELVHHLKDHHPEQYNGRTSVQLFAGLLKKGVDALPGELPEVIA